MEFINVELSSVVHSLGPFLRISMNIQEINICKDATWFGICICYLAKKPSRIFLLPSVHLLLQSYLHFSEFVFGEEVLLYSLVPIIQPSLHLDKRFRHFGCAWHTKELVGCPHRFLVGASPSTLTCISSTSLQFQPQPQPHFTSPHHSHLLFILLLNFSSLVPPSPQFYIVYVNPHIS